MNEVKPLKARALDALSEGFLWGVVRVARIAPVILCLEVVRRLKDPQPAKPETLLVEATLAQASSYAIISMCAVIFFHAVLTDKGDKK